GADADEGSAPKRTTPRTVATFPEDRQRFGEFIPELYDHLFQSSRECFTFRGRLQTMSGLASGLNIALQSLLTQQTAIETTSNNIANVNPPGYSRQRAELSENDPFTIGSLTLGSGVHVEQISSLRDSILDARVNQETQQQGQLGSFLSNAQQVQTLF